MNFSKALALLKQGGIVGRKGIALHLISGRYDFTQDTALINQEAVARSAASFDVSVNVTHVHNISSSLYRPGEPGSATLLPHIAQESENGVMVPYIPSHEDLLADDWEVIEEPESKEEVKVPVVSGVIQ